MQTRIVFNGHEYSDIEAMPDDVRRAFQDKLAQLSKDADHDGVPDVLQGRGIGIEGAAITINGRTIENIGSLPKPLRWLVNSGAHQERQRTANLRRPRDRAGPDSLTSRPA